MACNAVVSLRERPYSRFGQQEVYRMRDWFRKANSDDIKMVISGAVAVIAFATFVLAWSYDNYRRTVCEPNCITDLSAQRRH